MKKKIKKVLLIYPPIKIYDYEIRNYSPPLGLAYLAATIETDYDVKILDCVIEGREHREEGMIRLGLTDEEIGKIISRYNPDVVGISCLYSNQIGMTYRITAIAKEFNNKIIVVVGGAHASALPEEVLKKGAFKIDYVVIGEGEQTLSCLLCKLDKARKNINLDGIAYFYKNRVIVKPKKKYIKYLDDLPLPARHLIDMEKYFEKKTGHGFEQIGKRATSMISSRGCPFDCKFCSIHNVWGYGYRTRSAKNVVDEIEFLIKKYDVDEIAFEDDNLTLNYKRVEAICDEIIRRDVKINWTTPNGVYIHSLDENLLKKMKKSGCYKLCFGIESGDVDILKYMNKKINLEKAKNVIRICNEIGIWTHGFFIIGMPVETKGTIRNTLNFAVSSKLDFASFLIAMPYPGTGLYNEMQKVDYDKLKVMHSTIDTKNFTSDELNRIQKQMYSDFAKYKFFSLLNPISLYEYLKKPKAFRMMLRSAGRFLQIRRK